MCQNSCTGSSGVGGGTLNAYHWTDVVLCGKYNLSYSQVYSIAVLTSDSSY